MKVDGRQCRRLKEGHWVMMLATFQKMTTLWIKNGNAGAIPLLHTGLVSAILVNNMPDNLEYKQRFKIGIQIV